MITNTPKPPYYAVIFTNYQSENEGDLKGYGEMAQKMEELAAQQPGYLGFESARDGLGIAISYWKDEKSIHAWKQNVDHQLAQKLGREKWYRDYTTRICKIERDYSKKNSPDWQRD
jgi:heme-degrading monooxygenase HmoA